METMAASDQSDYQFRILIVENDEEYCELHAENVAEWGYIPIVAKGKGEQLLEDAKKKARHFRCHAAIVDLRLFDQEDAEDQEGIELIKCLIPVSCIVVTGFGSIRLAVEAVTKHSAVTLVDKTDSREVLRQALAEALLQWQKDVVIRPSGWVAKNIINVLDRDVTEEEVTAILCKLFPKADELTLEPLSGATRTPGKSSTGTSVVFKATARGNQPVVVKLTSKSNVARAVDNYEKYIDTKLGGNQRPELKGYWLGWEIAGVAYSLVGETGPAITYREHYQKQQSSTEPISQQVTPLKFFYEKVWEPHYQNNKPLKGSLFDTYNRLWGNSFPHSRFGDWEKIEKPVEVFGAELPNPYRWLAANYAKSDISKIRGCIIHGDLHSDNLLVFEDSSWVIDFERTGWGHTLTDFVELEVDLITKLVQIDLDPTEADYYAFLIALTKPQRPNDPILSCLQFLQQSESQRALNTIQELRQIAAQRFGTDEMREYYWGLLLDAMFVLTKLYMQINNDQIQKTTLLASVLCARLDKWSRTGWPLPHWPPVTWIHSKETDATNRQNIEAITRVIQHELAPLHEIEELTQSLQVWITAISRQTNLTQRDSDALIEAGRLVNDTTLSPKHRLVATLPIVPFLLAYQGEIELETGINLQAVWDRMITFLRPKGS